MIGIQDVILDVIEEAPQNRATAGYLLDQVDLRVEEFNMSEFDEAINELVDDGVIRVRNPRELLNDRLIEVTS